MRRLSLCCQQLCVVVVTYGDLVVDVPQPALSTAAKPTLASASQVSKGITHNMLPWLLHACDRVLR